MPTSSGTNATATTTEPPRKPPPSRPPAGSVRKPNWLLQPKIRRFDAPNLKPGSSLPTKASLGVVRTSNLSQPSASGRRDSTQTPTETSTSALEGAAAAPEPGSNADAQRQGSDLQSAGAQVPSVQDVPRLPLASMAETDAFLSDLMPPESVALPSSVHLTHIPPLLQAVGTHDV